MCGPLPVAKSEDIDDIKESYALTQSLLIKSCETHRGLVEWWRRNTVD